MKTTVFGFTDNVAEAEDLVDELRAAGFDRANVSVLFPDTRATHEVTYENSTKAPEGTVAGVGTGGILGGALGWLTGIGALAIPGLGPFIAAGPIIAALSGAAVGAAVGGIAGGLVGLGIPEYEAKRYETKVKEGKILVSVATQTPAECETARRIFAHAGAGDVSYTDERRPNVL
jgi:outer membrane lipoprotein SlyB